MKIAVDFDGTIVEHRYPSIGKERPFAVVTLKKLIAEKHQLILWTVREGELLQEAVDWCAAQGLYFYAINADYPEESAEEDPNYSRKLKADLFIDDRNLGGILDWGSIYLMIQGEQSYEDFFRAHMTQDMPKKKKWGLF